MTWLRRTTDLQYFLAENLWSDVRAALTNQKALQKQDSLIGRSLETLFETRPLDEILADMAIGWDVLKKETLTPVLAGVYNSDYEI